LFLVHACISFARFIATKLKKGKEETVLNVEALDFPKTDKL
jgi:hypothetical protein